MGDFFCPMPIQDHLAYSQQRKDQEPNKKLAKQIVESEDSNRIEELLSFWKTKPHKEHQKDCALTLAWIAQLRPSLIAPHTLYLLSRLNDPINRVIWGSMIALAEIAHLDISGIYRELPMILNAMDKGTVVTRDHGFRILVTIYQEDLYQEDIFCLILEQLSTAPSNQLGQYTERLLVVLQPHHKNDLIRTLEDRQQDITNLNHLNRLHKNLKKISKL